MLNDISNTMPANAAVGPIGEIHVSWLNAGLSCDGEPSIEDLVLGALPCIPKVNFHNRFLADENGDEFLERFHMAPRGIGCTMPSKAVMTYGRAIHALRRRGRRNG